MGKQQMTEAAEGATTLRLSKSPAGIVRAGLPISRLSSLLLVIQPGIDVLLHLILRMTVASLDLAF